MCSRIVLRIAEAELNARLLLEFVCGTDRNTLLVHGERELTVIEDENYVNLISERKKHIPLQYLTGVQEFMGLEFYVNQRVQGKLEVGVITFSKVYGVLAQTRNVEQLASQIARQ